MRIPQKIQHLLKSQFMALLTCTLSYKHLNLCLTTTLSTSLNMDLKELHPAPTEAKSQQP